MDTIVWSIIVEDLVVKYKYVLRKPAHAMQKFIV